MSFILQAPTIEQDERRLYQRWEDEKFLTNIDTLQLTQDNLKRAFNLLVKQPEIAYRQSQLETGKLKSRYATDTTINNLMGMHWSKFRETTACGYLWGDPHRTKIGDSIVVTNYKVAKYKHWSDCIYDYALYQQYQEKKYKVDLDTVDYYKFLVKSGYCATPGYDIKLKNLQI
jgi:hypothetical protein